MRIAVFSDTHGNLTALKAVLQSINREGSFDSIISAGDLIGGGPSVDEVVSLIQENQIYCLKGNYEELLLDFDKYSSNLSSSDYEKTRRIISWTQSMMSSYVKNWLGTLELSINFLPYKDEGLIICHANPKDCWRAAKSNSSLTLLNELYNDSNNKIIAFGHEHGSFITTLNNKLLINVSSVSQIRDGSNYSNYCIFEFKNDRWTAFHKKVEFDIYQEFKRIRDSKIPSDLVWNFQPFY